MVDKILPNHRSQHMLTKFENDVRVRVAKAKVTKQTLRFDHYLVAVKTAINW